MDLDPKLIELKSPRNHIEEEVMNFYLRKREKDTTSLNLVYKRWRWKILGKKKGECTYCSPNRGCNGWSSYRATRSWKNHRKTQYKELL